MIAPPEGAAAKPRRRTEPRPRNLERLPVRQVTREDFMVRIDDLLASVAASYVDFVAQGAPADAKEFAVFHGAARAAAVHLRTLHEFLRSLEQDDPAAPVEEADDA